MCSCCTACAVITLLLIILDVVYCTGDGAGVGKGRTIAGRDIMLNFAGNIILSNIICRYYLSELLRRQEEGSMVRMDDGWAS